ncbi:Gfo/Idh/MocA family oxidoreductase [Ureibacillus sp. Re31]|uniref:Gfo/Idh/MocA family oxidoreductase n=1 Tax=Ureibacillus galli TaxID=2762222 RepID=A0ABR8X8Q6_9BACL|nr:Gfo/Idh/MocA family oxidoreductase [Ureibacillus galli]MBD8025497.1 Gfo/Idh/MocA family oxidoreductase [Ureibacillus galli]
MKKKYVICGVSNRALQMFIGPMIKEFSKECQIVGLLDLDPYRFSICKQKYPQMNHVPTFSPEQFETMIEQTNPDYVIVAGRDDTHIEYILKSLRKQVNVITEKPMVTNAQDAYKVMKAEAESDASVIVTFNYRYSPIHRKIKEMILEGKVGRVTSVDLNWYIDTFHGSSYFRRWNRDRNISGGLSIHKSTHHFDLVNWWLDQKPEEVFAYGDLHYFGPDGELNPSKKASRFCGNCDEQRNCAYYRRWNPRSGSNSVRDDHLLAGVYEDIPYTNYRPDACIFDEDIRIEDTYVAAVKYDGGSLLSYSINFSAPYEGYRLAINGTKGRIETTEYHEPSRIHFQYPEQTIDYFPLFGAKETIELVKNPGGHGGGDPILLEDLFLGPDPSRSYPILAGSEAGAYSITVGEGVWRSVKEGKPMKIKELLYDPEKIANHSAK